MSTLTPESVDLLVDLTDTIRESSRNAMTASQVHAVVGDDLGVSRDWVARLLRYGVKQGMLTRDGYYYSATNVAVSNRVEMSMRNSHTMNIRQFKGYKLSLMGEGLTMMGKGE